MKIAYGYNRAETDFSDLEVDRLYIDTKATGRAERANMLAGTALREGDVIVMRAVTDLGHGREVPALRSHIAARGVTIEEIPLVGDPAPRGRPVQFDPTPDQCGQIKALYHGHFTMSHVLDRVEEIMGHRFKRHHLTHRYGPARWSVDD